MPEHYTKDTVQVQVWCKVCGKETMHRVDGGRRGPCLDCLAKREAEAAKRRPGSLKGIQLEMFGGGEK